MKKLQYLVLYKERLVTEEADKVESVFDNMNVLSEKDSAFIHEYMSQGLVLVEFVSPTLDPISEKFDTSNIVLTDGNYVWDGILMKWIKNYKVRLPQEFLNWAREIGIETDYTLSLNKNELLSAFKQADVVQLKT